MTALLVTITVAVALLAVLVAGLLRSHADILRALHSLGAGIGDPLDESDGDDHHDATHGTVLQLGRRLPPERATGAPEISGTTLDGDAVAITATAAPRTLLAFLSSGCTTCARFWSALREPSSLALPRDLRIVVVTKGLDLEERGALARVDPGVVELVLSTQAWIDYEVPGAPFFVLTDARGRRIGEGVAASMDQVVELVGRASSDDRGRAAVHGDGPARERENDRLLEAAGIQPGDPSLRPTSPHRSA
ncbi:MAG: hypothetical protein QOD30_2253 [Actinomycetota bacterium]|nr:hypothetical protein [Actinomycetota bacterium]